VPVLEVIHTKKVLILKGILGGCGRKDRFNQKGLKDKWVIHETAYSQDGKISLTRRGKR